MKVWEVDEKLENLKNGILRNHEDDILWPVTAFITFETQEGHERALKYEKKFYPWQRGESKTLLGEKLILEQAEEPSDIIWENRHVNKKTQTIKSLIVALISIFILVGAFILYYYIRKQIINRQSKYQSVNCAEILAPFKDLNWEQRQLIEIPFAVQDYYSFYTSPN